MKDVMKEIGEKVAKIREKAKALEEEWICIKGCVSYSFNRLEGKHRCAEGREMIEGLGNCSGFKKPQCHFCRAEIEKEDECGEFSVEIEGEVRRAHKKCYSRHLAGETNIRLVIK